MAKFLDESGIARIRDWVQDGANGALPVLDASGQIPLSFLGNVDTTFVEVVTELPTTGIGKHLYLVKDSENTSGNIYAEYVYAGDISEAYEAAKWEKLGDFRADVDLRNYAKKSAALGSVDNDNRRYAAGYIEIPVYNVDKSSATSIQLPVMTAASENEAGKAGLVPAPSAGEQGMFLRGDGTWATPTDTKGKNVVANTSADYTEASSTDNSNTYLNHIEGKTAVSSMKITGSGIVSVKSEGGDITITGTSPYTSAEQEKVAQSLYDSDSTDWEGNKDIILSLSTNGGATKEITLAKAITDDEVKKILNEKSNE